MPYRLFLAFFAFHFLICHHAGNTHARHEQQCNPRNQVRVISRLDHAPVSLIRVRVVLISAVLIVRGYRVLVAGVLVASVLIPVILVAGVLVAVILVAAWAVGVSERISMNELSSAKIFV